jgi:hypothetical protein
MQETASRQIVNALNRWRDTNEALSERTFLTLYGAPSLQAAAGIDPAGNQLPRKAAKNLLHHELLKSRIADLKARMSIGGLREALIRGLLYAGMSRTAVDERGFEMVRRIRRENDSLPLSEFKALVRDQFFMLLIDGDAALAAIPAMLPADLTVRQQALDIIRQVIAARGDLSNEDKSRLAQVAKLFGEDTDTAPGTETAPSPFRPRRRELQAKAS